MASTSQRDPEKGSKSTSPRPDQVVPGSSVPRTKKAHSRDEGSEESVSETPAKKKRAKISIACNDCRDKKIKCDGQRPCRNCVRKGIQDDCRYDRQKTQVSVDYVESLTSRIRELEELVAANHARTPEKPEEHPPKHGFRDIRTYQSAEQEAVDMLVHISLPNLHAGNEHPSPSAAPSYLSNYHKESPLRSMGSTRRENLMDSSATLSSISTVSAPRRRAASPVIGEIDAMGAMIHPDNTTQPTSPESFVEGLPVERHFPGRRETVPLKNPFHGGASVASFMNDVRTPNSHTSNEPHKRKHPVPGPRFTPLPGIIKRPKHPAYHPGETIATTYFLPPRKLADHLMDCYWEYVHPLYPFFHPPTFMARYEKLWMPHRSSTLPEMDANEGIYYALLNGIFALGCKFCPTMSLQDREINADAFFERSKPMVRIEIIDVGSLELVQTFLLNGQYLQGTTYASRCWNAIGMAIRLAEGLGLHIEGNIAREPDPILRDVKRRVWHGCVLFDRVLSMTLGRPCVVRKNHVALGTLLNTVSKLNMADSPSHPPQAEFYIQSLKLYSILGDIIFKVYDALMDDFGLITFGPETVKRLSQSPCNNSIIEINSTMTAFWNQVPQYLDATSPFGPNTLINRQAVVLRCRYLHLRIFLFRPLLTIISIQPPLIDDDMLSCYIFTTGARSCLRAALDLINLIYDNYNTDTSDAWWYTVFYIYTSAAVLIAAKRCFEYFENETTEEGIKECFEKAKEILIALRVVSLAARRCLEILEGLEGGVGGKREGQMMQQNHEDGLAEKGESTSRLEGYSATPTTEASNEMNGNIGPEDVPHTTMSMTMEDNTIPTSNGQHIATTPGLSGAGSSHHVEGSITSWGAGGNVPYSWVPDANWDCEHLLPSFEWLMNSEEEWDAGVGVGVGYIGG